MELGFGSAFDAFREEVREFIKGHWPPADGNFKSHENERAFVIAAIERGYMHRSIPKAYAVPNSLRTSSRPRSSARN